MKKVFGSAEDHFYDITVILHTQWKHCSAKIEKKRDFVCSCFEWMSLDDMQGALLAGCGGVTDTSQC